MQLLSTAFVAACFYLHSYAADVDPIVIKVGKEKDTL